mgnify:CR=1 FL=1
MDKKFFIGIAAMAALTLVSCSSDDLDSLSDNSSKNEAISFDGYLGRSTVAVNGSRGGGETANTLQTKGFGVFGKYTSTDGQTSDANFFKNQKVTYSTTESKWTYSPLKFWPSDGHIDFLAYAPYVNGTELTDGSKINNFAVSKVITDQKDLLWTNATSQITADVTSSKKKVNFQFHHALSRLGYTVNLTGDYSSNQENKATFTLKKITLAGSPDETKGAFYTSGTIDLSKQNNKEGLWSNQTGQQKFDWSSGDKLVTYVDPKDQTKKTVSNSPSDYLFVIPQDFSQTKTEENPNVDELYVIVEYTIHYQDGKEQTNKVYKQIKRHFLQGKAYNLNLTLGLPIEFDVDVTGVGAGVDGWDAPEDGTGDINIGSNDNPWDR